MRFTIPCSKQMVSDTLSAASERVGDTDVFYEGEILVRLNLVGFGGVRHHPVSFPPRSVGTSQWYSVLAKHV